jgi:uncharacterized OsmC-like protein
MPMVEFSIKAKSENVTKVVAETPGGFKITVDEPEKLGGTNEGPSPVEYVLAAFAGCLNVVGNMVAKEMDLKLIVYHFRCVANWIRLNLWVNQKNQEQVIRK